MSFNLSFMVSRQIEIFESSSVEFEKAKLSQPQHSHPSLNVSPTNGIIKIRNLPYSCSDEDIFYFFKEFKVIAVKRGYNGGRINDEGFVIFENGEEATKAMKLNMEKIAAK